MGVLDWGPKQLPLGGWVGVGGGVAQFTLRAAGRGHIKHSASVAAAAEGFACVSCSIPPLRQH